MNDRSSIFIDGPKGHTYVNEFNDTLIMFFINLNDDATILTATKESEILDVIIYPNSSVDVLHVFGDDNLVEFAIHNIGGTLVRRGAYNFDGVDIRNLDEGPYVLVVTNKNGDTGSVLFEKR